MVIKDWARVGERVAEQAPLEKSSTWAYLPAAGRVSHAPPLEFLGLRV